MADSNYILPYTAVGIIPYFDYVFDYSRRFDHSGVLSPAINLDPQYNNVFGKRLQALKSLEQWFKQYETARNAVEWCMNNDEDAMIRSWARLIWDRNQGLTDAS